MTDEKWEILIRLTQNEEVLYEGEIRPGSIVLLKDELVLSALWIRKETDDAQKQSAIRDKP